jgi:tetratricopeptide (TPR) repeat protein
LPIADCRLSIADCRLSIVGAENRNSKIETRLHWGAAVSFPSFEFLVSSFEYQQSAIDNRQSAIGAGAVYIIGMISMQKACGRKTGWRSFGLAHRAGRRSPPAAQRRGVTSAPKVGKTAQAPPKVGKVAQAPPSGSERAASRLDRVRILLIAALVACATLPYLNILVNGFVYDDNLQLVQNPYVRSLRYLKEIFATNVWSFATQSVTNYYRPMMTLGYLVCYKLFGLRPYGFHLFSLLLHVLVVCLVFALTERVTGDRVWAFVAGALFALHPIHSESVAWIAAVTDLEVTFFYLLTFGLFLALARPGDGRSEGMVAAMGGTFLLALLSKEQAMTLPALATVYEHFYRADRSETSLSQKLARYGVLWLVGMAYLLFRIHFLGALAPGERLRELTPPQIMFCALALVGQYLWKVLWPVRLCAFYVFHPSTRPFDLRVLAGLLVLLALGAVFMVCWRSREGNVRFASFGIIWFIATLAPALNPRWVGENVFTERYLYLPSVGVVWLIGLGAAKLWSRAGPRPGQRRALALAGLALGGLCAARIVIRNRDWNNDIVFYTRTLELSPDADNVLGDLGDAYWLQGDADKAESTWRRALALNPNRMGMYNGLGLLASKRHQYAEAKALFQRAMQLAPRLGEPHLNLGDMYLEMGQRGPAELQYRAAVALTPRNIRARNKLGQLLFAAGRPTEAEVQFRASVRSSPNPVAYDYLGMFSIRRGDLGEAARDFQAALSLQKSDSYAHFGLGDIYTVAGRKVEALGQYQAGLVSDPTNAQALAAVQKLRQEIAGLAP